MVLQSVACGSHVLTSSSSPHDIHPKATRHAADRQQHGSMELRILPGVLPGEGCSARVVSISSGM